MHAFENEYIQKKGNDFLLSIDVLPDRAGDCFSHIGIAREISALLNKKATFPKVKSKKVSSIYPVKVEDSNDCLRYTTVVLDNVKIEQSPKWLKDKLSACGVNSINNVVDVTNYIMLETGQPLHAFDYDKVSEGIVVRRAKEKEKIVLLNGKEYILNKDTLVIADNKDILALAGIKGGKKAEITKNTKKIILESANFNHKLISQTARKLNIRTDASIRYEQNIDPNLTEYAINRAIDLINFSVISQNDIYTKKLKPWSIKIDIEEINNTIGIEISKKDIISILSKLGFIVKKDMLIEVPTYRQDVLIPENITEEIGRVYGYDKVPSVLPLFSHPAEINNDIYWQNRIKDIMKELGYSEVFNYSFIGDEEKDSFNLRLQEITNPVSSCYKYLRPTIIPQLIKATKENLKYFERIKIFEIGKVFDKKEYICFSGAVNKGENLKSDLLALLNSLGINNAIFGKDEIKIGKEIIGKVGIRDGITFFEFNFEKIQKNAKDNKEYKIISYHPVAVRDISGLIDDEVKIEDIINKINEFELINSVEVFDIYKGKGVPEGKKSVSMHITLQSQTRTLDPETIDKVITKIKETINWEERK